METCVRLGLVYKQHLRQTEGFVGLCCMNQILKVLFNFCQKSGKFFGIRHAEFCHDIKNISSYFTFGFLV
ncbi:hypothetical protein [Candidatus Tisiphia endosymbiont of Mystacides longicornis]|uniref:hypothetical protein n=1 Tax=Candidatus Tisiphia endosymbiont of Mystacides longicornis TaxID=3139330 RepID=UPI003CCB3370